MTNTTEVNTYRQKSLTRRARFGRLLIIAQMVVRIYGGYKLIQLYGHFVPQRDLHERYARHHRRSAELVYRTALRLEGWLVKACQFIGTRADILPPEYIEVLSRLHDKVPPRPFALIKQRVEEELKKPLGEVFASFAAEPVAAASLAQVHKALLRDGRPVAVKVQYPDVATLVDLDMQNIAFFVEWLARIEPRFDFRFVMDRMKPFFDRWKICERAMLFRHCQHG